MPNFEAAEVTKEELTYLDLRKKLKEHHRKQFKQDSSTSSPSQLATTTKRNDFGSFFGPSQPTTIPSVIKNTTFLREFSVLTMSSNPSLKKVVKQSTPVTKILKPNPTLVTTKVDPKKVKMQKMKYARDYSFLHSDDKQPQRPLSKKISASNPDRTSPKIPQKNRAVFKVMKHVSLNAKMPDKTTIKKNSKSSDGADRLKIETITLKKNVTIRNGKHEITSLRVGKSIDKATTKPVVTSKASLQIGSKKRHLHQMNTNEGDENGFDYRNEIRKMFKYNPDKYEDDRDTRNMEAGFHDILKEEKRSGLIARKEDQIELKRIEEEAMKEKMLKGRN